MPKMKDIKIVLRFGAKEADLQLLAEQYNLKQMVIWATEYYLGLTDKRIPLPLNKEIHKKFCTISLNYEEDMVVYNFFKNIPVGYRSLAAKLLLRHASEKCDLRFIFDIPPAKNKPPAPKAQLAVKINKELDTSLNATKEQKADNVSADKKCDTKQVLQTPTKPTPSSDINNDNIFNLI